MAYLHRVTIWALSALFLLFWTSGDAHASFNATLTNPTACTAAPCPTQYGYTDLGGTGQWFSSWYDACQAFLTRQRAATPGYIYEYAYPNCYYNIKYSNGNMLQANAGSNLSPVTRTQPLEAPSYSCPTGSTLSGSSCSCNSGYTQNGDNASCSSGACGIGNAMTTTSISGWLSSGDLVGAYTGQNQLTGTPGCMQTAGGNLCAVSFSSTAPPRENIGNFGHSYYTYYLSGSTTGATCGTLTPLTATPPTEPSCEGQQGIFNGVTICRPKESQASIDARAASVAAAAASAARLAAINAGRTPDQADAAARAAGDAAAQALRSGSSPSAAAAAGAAAGSAAASAAASGADPSSTMQQGSAAGAVQAAGDRARAIATASGASASTIAQAESSARAAAATTAASVLKNGGTQAQAMEAARIAGQTATASVLAGSTGTQAVKDGENAGIGSSVGSKNGTGGAQNGTQTPSGQSQDPVGDFCTKNPQAQMCKTTPDSSFGGTCGSPPVCEGDAVMCAVAASTFATNCAMTQQPTDEFPEYALYRLEAAKSQADQVALSATTVNVGPSQFDQTNFLGAASGVSDLSITVWHKTVSIPLSQLNTWLQRLGVVLQAVTFLLCARIVIRG